MTISTMMNKTAIAKSNSVQSVEQKIGKSAIPSKETSSSLYWANVLNSKAMLMDESENLVSNKTKQIKRRVCWWM